VPTVYHLNPPAHSSAARRRKRTRDYVFTIGALVSARGLNQPLGCVVRDLSEAGARLEVERDPRKPARPVALPDRVKVYFCPMETEVACRVTWRDGDRFGVAFAGVPRKLAKRPI
jgi:hypothetical protein